MPELKFMIDNGCAGDAYAKCYECGWDGHRRQTLIDVEAAWSPAYCPKCLSDDLAKPDTEEVKDTEDRFIIPMTILGYCVAIAAMIVAFTY